MSRMTPVTALRGVGEALAGRLRAIGVESIQDLLFLLPLRYEDRTRTFALGELRPGMRVAVEGEVQLAEVAFRGRRQLLCRIADGSGQLTLRFFHFSADQQRSLVRGLRLRCFGEVRRSPSGLEMVHPEYRRVDAAATATPDHLTPVYPATEGLTQGRLRQLVGAALERLDQLELEELVPARLLSAGSPPSLREALRYLHRPPPEASLEALMARRHPAHRRLAYEELLAHHLSLKVLRRRIRDEGGWPLPAQGDLESRLRASLPFSLTAAQARALAEIDADLARPTPMLRLVQGDVGCGKTLVAALAATRALAARRQVALMAPTELLAEQHAQNFRRWFEPLGVAVELLAGRRSAAARRAALAGAHSGSAPILIGTHALFQEGVEFAALALVIVDEQHRFGVHQRLSLGEKGAAGGRRPHQLIMTATPIPRTLAMTAYADLDVSVIDELPPGRTPVRTVVTPDSRREEVVQRIRSACLEGRQAYWVCPLIDESEDLPYQAAEETAASLAEALTEIRVGLVHGRMPAAAKERAMARFKAGELQLLVATTVIEVGVDVPNATLMVIENAERMGLAQLHQLRGRVGRGAHASSCVLMYRAPLSALARERLAVMRDTNDGFEVARRDLELRGPGELLGTRQTGLAQLRVADLVRDADLLPRVQSAADTLLTEFPDRVEPLVRRWVGGGERYARVG
ncbi:MAG: ATP-dependent DNA helicase RecG [Gammaproteobacteria bacterium]|nr:ATP-dependent DNA helicase RecG [Gammaproteobacteria bacterium]